MVSLVWQRVRSAATITIFLLAPWRAVVEAFAIVSWKANKVQRVLTVMSANKKNRFITNKMCPFAQKAWIALETSHVPYTLQELSLYGAGGKPDWFWKLNPQGMVPVLVVEESSTVLPDSDDILNAFETEKVPGGSVSLTPDNPKLRNEVAAWRRRINQMLPIGKQAVFSSQITKALDAQLHEMNASMIDGPYLTGNSITTADCHAFPFLWRLHQEFDLSQRYERLAQWIAHCSQQPSFRRTIQSSWWWWW